MWHRDYERCASCKETTSKHMAKGLCKRCYLAQYRAANKERIATTKHDWYVVNVAAKGRGKIERESRNFDGRREAVLRRDGHCCRKCGSTEKLVVHHIDGNGRGSKKPNNKMRNMLTLCRSCHVNLHRAELRAARKIRDTCAAGHPKTPENGFRNYQQWVCRVCARERARKYAKHRKEG